MTNAQSMDIMADSRVINAVLDKYGKLVQSTLDGEFGKTAQFWLQYFGYVDLFLIMDRAVRTNDVDLFIWVITQVTDVFFATNRHYYSRWMTKYQLE